MRSETYERYERAFKYYARDSRIKAYYLYRAAEDVSHGKLTREEFEELCDIAFPPGREREAWRD